MRGACARVEPYSENSNGGVCQALEGILRYITVYSAPAWPRPELSPTTRVPRSSRVRLTWPPLVATTVTDTG
jgi:hypothetical protein